MRPPLRAPRRALGPALAGGLALALYLLTLNELHGGDTVAYVQEVLLGQVTHRHHLLPRSLAALTLWWGETLVPGLSPYTGTAVSCALGGAAVVALLYALVQRMTARAPLAALAAALAAVASAPWRMSTTFEVHIWPVAALLGCALLVLRTTREEGRALGPPAAAGALQGAAMALHVLAIPVALAWAVALAAQDRPWRERLAQLLAFAAVAAAVLQLVYLGARLIDPSFGALTPAGLLLEDLLADKRTAPAPTSPWAVAGAAAHAWVMPGRFDAVAGGGGVLVALAGAGLALGRARALWRRWRGMALAPLLWPLLVVPLTAVDPSNWEYWTGAVVACTWLLALVLSDALEAGGRWRRAARITGGMAALWAGVLAAHGTHRGGSPVGVPVGVVHHPEGLLELEDGRGGRWLWREDSEPLRLP